MQKNEPQQDASKKRIQMIAKRQLEEERQQMENLKISDSSSSTQPEKEQELEHSSAISKVLYTSELLGEDHVGTRAELLEDIKHFLIEQIKESDDENDKIIAAVLMLYSLNKSQTRDTAVETISRYCQNILENPGVEKFVNIRLGNKAYQERIAPAVGAREFLEAIGFTPKTDNGEAYLVFTKSSDAHLVEAIGALREGQSVPIKVARNLEVFRLKPGQQPKAPKLGPEFFNRTTAELKAEQKNREIQVERMLTLRTKEMRQKDEQLANYSYKYTMIRVRLPGNYLIQGVFGCHEPFSAVRLFVSSALSPSLATAEFTLRDAVSQMVEDENLSLAQLSLAPAALLHLILADTNIDEGDVIADEYVERIRELE
uniref:UBX domain-containing protein n=2 Tax=Caenorhabditis tropicalis TaxID=1561998 RepID=A0A1I7TC82_9PELO